MNKDLTKVNSKTVTILKFFMEESMDWKKIILMAKGKADKPELETDTDHLIWRARLLLQNTIKPALREVLEFLEEQDIPFDKKRSHYVDTTDAIGAQLIIGTESCNVDMFIGLSKEAIVGRLSELRYVHIDRTNLMELPLNETRITSEEVKRLLAEDVRVYYEKLLELQTVSY